MSFASAVFDNIYPPASFCEHGLPHLLRVPCFFNLSAGDRLEEVLNRPFHLFLEIGERQILEESITRIIRIPSDFTLSISTYSAYHGNIACIVSNFLDKRFERQPDVAMSIQTCLQEALINAIVHGNLGIDGQFESPESFDAYYTLISRRLAQENLASRRITISATQTGDNLTLSIHNQGSAFSMKSPSSTIACLMAAGCS